MNFNTDIDGVVSIPTNMHKEISSKRQERRSMYSPRRFNGGNVDALEIQGNRKFDQVCYLLPHRTFPKNIYVKEIIDSAF